MNDSETIFQYTVSTSSLYMTIYTITLKHIVEMHQWSRILPDSSVTPLIPIVTPKNVTNPCQIENMIHLQNILNEKYFPF